MARPKTDGLRYFPFDVDFFSDTKIRIVQGHFGTDGIAVYMYLLCEIYRSSGYYVLADEDFIACTAADFGFSIDKTRQIIAYLCGRSLFDNTLFTSVKVLTAKSIQRRYQEARKGAKRDIFVDRKLWLLDESETPGFIKVCPSDSFSEKNPGFSEKNPRYSRKNHTKESRINKNKLKESKAEQAPLPAPDSKALRDELISEYGKALVTAYEEKFDRWQAGKSFRADKHSTIAKWMAQDGIKPQHEKQSGSDGSIYGRFSEDEINEICEMYGTGGNL